MASPSQENGKVANGTNGETLPSLEASNSPRNPDGCKKDDTMNDRFNNTSLLSHVEPYSYKGTEAEAARWQWLFSPSDMAFTPSVIQSSLTEDREQYNRWKGVQLILRIGDYMRIGNHVMATASIFFHRFYMRKAMPRDAKERSHDTFAFQEIAPTCVFLACKVEETHRKLHSVIEATKAVLDQSPEGVARAEARMYKVDVNSREYRRWKDVILLNEERLLETICFDLIIDQPHSTAIKACQRLQTDREMARLTILILNSLLHGAVSIFYDAETLAAAAFLKACQYVDRDPGSFVVDHETGRKWTDAFDVDQEEVDDAMPQVAEFLAFHNERIKQQHNASSAKSSVPATPNHQQILSVRGDGNHLNGSDPEERSESRPISRHGSRGFGEPPPPPMSRADNQPEQATVPATTSPANDVARDLHNQAAMEKITHEQSKMDRANFAQIPREPPPLLSPKIQPDESESEEEGAL